MSQIVPFDPRFPIPDSMGTDDPHHPINLTKRAMELQNQAAADMTYDPPPPKRFKGSESFRTRSKEAFRNPFEGPSDWIMAIGLLLLLGIIHFYSKDSLKPMYILILTLVIAILFMAYKKALADYT